MFSIEQPSFYFEECTNGKLHILAGHEEPCDLRRYMAGSIQRHPRNLKRHVQNIYSLIDTEQKDGEAIFAAIIDLFIVLEQKGLALRQRMLRNAKPYISSANYQFLSEQMVAGITSRTHLEAVKGSLLTGGCHGDFSFVKHAAPEVVVDNVNSEQGGGKAEQDLLEEQFYADPSDKDVALKLIAIYQRIGDKESENSIVRWFAEKGIDL